MQTNAKTRVLIVDDSALIRSVMSEIINREHDMEVVGTASNPLAARELIKQLDPDVLTLDVEMPKMDGLDFLGRLMRLRPMPVLMVSSLTKDGSEAALRALELGAVDCVAKPTMSIQSGMREYAQTITDKIRGAASVQFNQDSRVTSRRSAGAAVPRLRNPLTSREKLIIIGASTGGTEAIRAFLEPLPEDCPGILITQHMPEQFTALFAKRLDKICTIAVKEAAHGERILPGHAYIAPGDCHLLVERKGGHFCTALSYAEPVNRHRPSVDVLFESAAAQVGQDAIGIILTGMGKDGAAGMVKMRQAGAYNLAQSESSCVVYGMPKAAVELDAVHEILPLDEMPARVMARLNEA
jgi:two-component system chemotaxis response regulator CheB